MRKTLITLLLLLFSWSLHARVAPDLLKQDSLNNKKGQQLKKGWLIQPAGSADWMTATAPDSSKAWYALNSIDDLSTIKRKIKQFEGICWLKCYIKADTGVVGIPLSLSAIHNGASEVYLDNRYLCQTGMFSGKNKKGVYLSRERPVAFVLTDTGIHELLVKYENKKLAYTGKAGDKNELILKLNTADYTFGRLAMTAKQNIFLIISIIFFSFSLFHFILFLFYRKDLSNLFFSLFNLAMGVFFMMGYKAILSTFGGPSAWQDYLKVAIVSIAVAGLALSGLVNKLFDKFGWRFLTIVSLGVVSVVLMWFTETVALGLIAITINVTLIEVIFLLLRAFIRKVQGAKILAIGILLDFLFAIILVILLAVTGAVLGYGEYDINGISSKILFAAIFFFAILVVFCIPVSMSVYLAWKTAYVNKQLEMQLARVEALSLEKQSILEHQKERLEEEVIARTSELALQKKKSDDLLLNILPAEVADELKIKGSSDARQYEEVSVLFTDFVNFTSIAEQMTPEVLLAELNDCFTAFDNILERHRLEKIKTIGDAYLAVGGLPQPDSNHAVNTVNAAMEIVAFINERKIQKGEGFEIRVGINSGPLVAGIVGVKKFAYDIWGDTVNTASRMESSSEAGKINISEATYQLVKNTYRCTYRGKINAKNKGAIDMYFVDGPVNGNI